MGATQCGGILAVWGISLLWTVAASPLNLLEVRDIQPIFLANPHTEVQFRNPLSLVRLSSFRLVTPARAWPLDVALRQPN